MKIIVNTDSVSAITVTDEGGVSIRFRDKTIDMHVDGEDVEFMGTNAVGWQAKLDRILKGVD